MWSTWSARRPHRWPPYALDYRRFYLLDPDVGIVTGSVEGRAAFTLDDVEDWLTGKHR